MIAVVVSKAKSSGLFDWSVHIPVVAHGRSRQPLLDACRVLKSMGVATRAEIGMFHRQANGAVSTWSCKTTVGRGAELTVEEGANRGSIKFRKYEPYEVHRDHE